jgi:hypothetical protein
MKNFWRIYRLKITVSLAWAVLSVAACWNAYEAAVANEQITALIQMALLMLGGLGVVISIIHQSESMIANTAQMRSQIEFQKMENTFSLFSDWDNESLLGASKLTRQVKKEEDSLSKIQLLEKINGDENLEHSVIMAFNFWEQVYLSVKNDRVHEDTLKEAFQELFCDMFKRFKPWIDEGSSSPSTKASLIQLNSQWSS